MEKRYITDTNPYEGQGGEFFQRMNDMLALVYFASFKLRKTPEAYDAFFAKKEKFKRATENTTKMQEDLIKIKEMKNIKSQPILNEINDFVTRMTDEDKYTDLVSYYARTEGHPYFLVSKLMNDIANNRVDQEQAVAEFKEFATKLENAFDHRRENNDESV